MLVWNYIIGYANNAGMLVRFDDARKKLGLPEQGKLLLFFGFIRQYKGLDILLKAMANERIKNRRHSLVGSR